MKHASIFAAALALVAWTSGPLRAESAPTGTTSVTPAPPAVSSPATLLPGLVEPIPLAVNCTVACERNYETCWNQCNPQDWEACMNICLSVRYECRCACPNPDYWCT